MHHNHSLSLSLVCRGHILFCANVKLTEFYQQHFEKANGAPVEFRSQHFLFFPTPTPQGFRRGLFILGCCNVGLKNMIISASLSGSRLVSMRLWAVLYQTFYRLIFCPSFCPWCFDFTFMDVIEPWVKFKTDVFKNSLFSQLSPSPCTSVYCLNTSLSL